MVTFPQDVCRSIAVRIYLHACRRAIQPAFYPLATERDVLRIVGVVGRNLVPVKETRFRRIGFFLFHIENPVSFAEGFNLAPERPMWNLHEVLVVAFANVNVFFPSGIDANNDFAESLIQTVVDDVTSRLAEIILNVVIAVHRQSRLLFRGSFDLLQVFDALKFRMALVVPMVDAFEGFPVDEKRRPIGVHARRQVVHPKVNGQCSIRINGVRFFFLDVPIRNLEKARVVLRVNPYFLDGFTAQSFWEWDLDVAVFAFESQ